jgi:RHS repeat-associated protein
VGEILQSRMIYRKNGASDYTRTSEQTYDHVGRVKDSYYTLTEGTTTKVPRLLMSSLVYDNIGRIKTKFIQPQANLKVSKSSGNWTTTNIWQNNSLPTTNSYVVISKGDTVTIPANTTVTAATLYDAGLLKFLGNAQLQMSSLGNTGKPSLQEIGYTYNVRNQMRGVNLDANGNPQTSADKLFSYRIDYHEDGRYFDGSISKVTWKSSVTTTGVSAGTKSYTYYYDRAGRLTSAISGTSEENFSIPRVSYDANGNITFLSRMAKVPFNGNLLTTKIDSLDYQYLSGGNKLRSVSDKAIRASLGGFKDGNTSGDDYAYYADGKLQKDLNRNVSLIEYNYLDLVSKVKFVNNDSIQYFYTTTGEKRQTRRVIAGITSYTLYDGEMIYTFTGNPTSLSDFKVSEIQNSEGRYVNGKLEYGYTDHLGNLRLSYKDSLGTAFVTQGYAFDAWGLELKLHRYQFSNTTPDRYTWQGKEDLEADNLEGWSDFGWRIQDKTLGRWFTPDPEDQSQAMTTYGFCGNNPVMQVDPDGRAFQLLPFLAATIFSGHVGGMISMGGGGSYGKGFVTGALGGAAGYFAPIGFLPGMAYGAGTGAAIGGINSSMNGGNFWDGALRGGITGGILGGISGGLGALSKKGNFWTGYREPHALEALGGLKGKGVPYTDETLNNAVDKFSSVRPKELSGVYRSAKWTPKGWSINEKGNLTGKIGGKATEAVAVTVPRTWIGGNTYNISISPAGFQSIETLYATLAHEYGHVVFNSVPSLLKESQESSFLDHYAINDMGHASIFKMQYEFAVKNGFKTYINEHSSYWNTLFYPSPFATSQTLDDAIKHLASKRE